MVVGIFCIEWLGNIERENYFFFKTYCFALQDRLFFTSKQ